MSVDIVPGNCYLTLGGFLFVCENKNYKSTNRNEYEFSGVLFIDLHTGKQIRVDRNGMYDWPMYESHPYDVVAAWPKTAVPVRNYSEVPGQ